MIRSRHIARIALLAFLCNALLPFFAVYNTGSHNAYAKQMSSLFGEKVLICTGDGFKWVRWQDLQNQKPHDGPDHEKCPLCYMAAHGFSAIAPEAPSVVLLSYPYAAAVSYYLRRHPLSSPVASLGSRAPPVPYAS